MFVIAHAASLLACRGPWRMVLRTGSLGSLCMCPALASCNATALQPTADMAHIAAASYLFETQMHACMLLLHDAPCG